MYITRYWKLVQVYRRIARERKPVCAKCLQSSCHEATVGFYDGLALATWWCGLITSQHWQTSIVTDNLLYPQFPAPSLSGVSGVRFTPPDLPMSVMVLERKESWGFYNTGVEYPELREFVTRSRFGLGNGAYYGYFDGVKFRAVATFRLGKWYKPKPIVAGLFNRKGTIGIPRFGVPHEEFIVNT